jgi:hypothetical protein
MAHLEDNDMLHPEVFLYEDHALCALDVFKRVIVLAIKAIHDISLKVLEEIHLAFGFLRMVIYRVVLADVRRAMVPRGDEIKRAEG